MMANPWLEIDVADYLGHMHSPAVNQGPILNELLREALQDLRPRTVLVVGCSDGNGLEHVDPAITRSVTALDINPVFLARLGDRLSDHGFQLDVRCADVASATFEPAAFDLIHAALLFEYVEWMGVLPRLVSALSIRGTFSVVLQQPSPTTPAVTPSPYTRLQTLESLFRFVDPDSLIARANQLSLTLAARRRVPLPGAKAFEVLRFRRNG
jgi:SAM-dependent methyltransferase